MKTEIVQTIQDCLINKINPAFIILFGSYAKGTTHPNSDIDVAFFSEDAQFTSYDLFLMAQELADILKMEVDLVDLSMASTVFKAQIYTTGIVIYTNDDIMLKKQKMTTLSMYARLNEERKAILEKIDERGSIYEK